MAARRRAVGGLGRDDGRGVNVEADLAGPSQPALLAGREGDRASPKALIRDISRQPALLDEVSHLHRLADAPALAIEMDDGDLRRGLEQLAEVVAQAILEAAGDLQFRAIAHKAQRVIGNEGISLEGHGIGFPDLHGPLLDVGGDVQRREHQQDLDQPAPQDHLAASSCIARISQCCRPP